MSFRIPAVVLFAVLVVLSVTGDAAPTQWAQAQSSCTDVMTAGYTGASTAGAQVPIRAGALEVVGQSFTPTQSVTLTRASLFIANSGASVPITLTVNTDVGDTPGAQLASATAIPPTSTGSWMEFTFGSNPLLGVGASYLLVATTTESTGAYQWAAAHLPSGDPYVGGKRYYPGHGDAWDHFDQLFQVSGCPAVDPTATPPVSCTPAMAAGYGSSESDGTSGLVVAYGQGTVGQSFTPSVSVVLTRASLFTRNAGGTLIASIHEDGGGAPGVELARRGVHPNNSSYAFVDFAFPPGVVLEAGRTYYVIASTLQQPGYNWLASSANPYPGGGTYVANYLPAPGFPFAGWDQLFQIWGCPTGAATPAATATPTGTPTRTRTATATPSLSPTTTANLGATHTPTRTPTPPTSTSLVLDTFSRTVATGWATPEVGGQWFLNLVAGTSATNASSLASVSGGRGRANVTASGSSRYFTAVSGSLTAADYEVLATVNSGPTGSLVGVLGRATTSGVYLAWMVSGQNTIRLTTGAVQGPLGSGVLGGPVIANTDYTMRFQLQGTSLRARAWQTGTSEPTGWQVAATDNHVAAGLAGVMAGFPNSGSATFSFDDINVTPLNGGAPSTTSTSTATVSATPTPSETATPTPTQTWTPLPSPTSTATPSRSTTSTATRTTTNTLTLTTTRTVTASATVTATPITGPFALMGLRGGVNSIASAGAAAALVQGDMCARGAISINGGNFTVQGQTSANQGFSANMPNSTGGNFVPGAPCEDPLFDLPAKVTFTDPPTSGRVCVYQGGSGQPTDACKDYPLPGEVVGTNVHLYECAGGSLNITDGPNNADNPIARTTRLAMVYINCSNSNVNVYGPRSLIAIDSGNRANIEIRGTCTSNCKENPVGGTTDDGISIVQKIGVFNLSANSPAQAACSNCGQISLGPGYYDVVDMTGIGGAPSGSNSSFSCGTHTSSSLENGGTQASLCLKPGLYLMSTGLIGNPGTDIGSLTTAGSASNATGSGVTIVTGISFLPKGPGGGGGGIAFDCCANDSLMIQNNVLLYHLGGCGLPFSDSSNRFPQSAADTRTILPVWPAATFTTASTWPYTTATGSWTCNATSSGSPGGPAQANGSPVNVVDLLGNNVTQIYNGTIYSPYQCSAAFVPPNDNNPADNSFPAACASGSAAAPAGASRLPQFPCGTATSPACAVLGGGSTQINGRLIAPTVQFNGNGVAINPPSGP